MHELSAVKKKVLFGHLHSLLIKISEFLHCVHAFLSLGQDSHPVSVQRLAQFPCASSNPLIHSQSELLFSARSGAHEVQFVALPAHVLHFMSQAKH